MFGMHDKDMMAGAMFGKRRRVAARRPAHTRKAAMKAFRSFYKRHCAGHRAMGFGNGGNPMLSASMGYEFCPNGSGGVLGANSTGLFPSPCTAPSSSGYGLRRRRAAAIGNTEARRKARANKMKKDPKYFMKGHKEYPGYAIGAPKRRRRRATDIGAPKRRRRCAAVGVKRRSAAGAPKRRRRRAEFGGGFSDFVRGLATGGLSNKAVKLR